MSDLQRIHFGPGNSRQRSGHGHVTGISRSFSSSGRLVAAIQWMFSGLAGIAASARGSIPATSVPGNAVPGRLPPRRRGRPKSG